MRDLHSELNEINIYENDFDYSYLDIHIAEYLQFLWDHLRRKRMKRVDRIK